MKRMKRYSYMTTKTTREPCVGDIWLVHFPYATPGNMEKVRPAIIVDFDEEDNIIVQKLTTKRKRYNKEFNHPKMKKKTYLSQEKTTISDYHLIRYLGRT